MYNNNSPSGMLSNVDLDPWIVNRWPGLEPMDQVAKTHLTMVPQRWLIQRSMGHMVSRNSRVMEREDDVVLENMRHMRPVLDPLNHPACSAFASCLVCSNPWNSLLPAPLSSSPSSFPFC